MAQVRSTNIILMIKLAQTSRLSIKNSVSLLGGMFSYARGTLVSWKLKCIAHSSAEGECMATSRASLQAIWLLGYLTYRKTPPPRTLP